MREVTISDIAERAGVGKATVSRVVNRSGYVAEETRRRVEAAIQELGYTPSEAARSLSRREGSAIGLVIPEITNPFFSTIIEVVGRVVDEKKLVLLLANTSNSARADERILSSMRKQRLRGLVYTPAAEYHGEDAQRIAGVLRLICPVVLLDRPISTENFDGVFTDNYLGGRQSAEALIMAGHRHIGIVAGDLALEIGRRRFEGFRDALKAAGLPLNPRDVIHGEFDAHRTYTLTREMLGRTDRPTAFFVSNNQSGGGFLKAIFERGLRIPHDMGYVGFDPVEALDLFSLHFSCLERNVANMGADAIRLLFKRIANPNGPREQLVLAPTLKLTGSEMRIT